MALNKLMPQNLEWFSEMLNGSQTLKLPPSCGDFIFNVVLFNVNLTAPANNSATINSGGNLNITANNTGGNAFTT